VNINGPFGPPGGPPNPFNRGADIYHSQIGNDGGAVNLNYKDSGKDHVTIQHGDNARFSFDVDIQTGKVSGAHVKIQK
jgi:hypothetical protein